MTALAQKPELDLNAINHESILLANEIDGASAERLEQIVKRIDELKNELAFGYDKATMKSAFRTEVNQNLTNTRLLALSAAPAKFPVGSLLGGSQIVKINDIKKEISKMTDAGFYEAGIRELINSLYLESTCHMVDSFNDPANNEKDQYGNKKLIPKSFKPNNDLLNRKYIEKGHDAMNGLWAAYHKQCVKNYIHLFMTKSKTDEAFMARIPGLTSKIEAGLAEGYCTQADYEAFMNASEKLK